MSLYDSNYFLIQRLIPDLADLPEFCVSSVNKGPDLYLEIVESFKFTTSLRLTYYFKLERGEQIDYIPDPDLALRVYHDAKVAEVMSCKPQGFMPISKASIADAKQLSCRWDSNHFLQKWLEYLLDVGHNFSADNIKQADRKKFIQN